MSLHKLSGYDRFPFGKESTAEEIQKRITWEKANIQYLSTMQPAYYDILVEGHQRACRAYRELLVRKYGLTA